MKITESEIWKPVRNYEGLYEVSNLGHVRSLTRKIKTSKGIVQTWKGQLLTPDANESIAIVTDNAEIKIEMIEIIISI